MLRFSEFLSEGVYDPSIFKAIFLAGGPGSGKSFIVGKTALTSLGFRLINSDVAFERALAKADLEPTPENISSEIGQEIRGRAVELTGKMMNLAIEGRLGLIIDGTGKNYKKIEGQVNDLRKLGYDVAMIFVNTDLETALERNRMRSRSLDDKMVEDLWKMTQQNIGKFQNLFRNQFYVVDNSEDSNFEAAAMNAYKAMSNWSKQQPSSAIANRWIKGQMSR